MASPRSASGRPSPEAPPPGPPWDLPLAEAPLAFVDLEMTGLDASKDRVIEICIERVEGPVDAPRLVGALSTLVLPEEGAIGNVHIHGLDRQALAEAPAFGSLADRVRGLLEGAIFVAHGAAWDVAFVRAEMERAGRPLALPFYIDTLNLSRRAFGLAKHSLEALRVEFGLDGSRAHRADADVAALREVFARCVRALSPSTPRDLWQVRIADRHVREHVLAQCKDALEAKREITLVYRARARPAEPLRMVLTAIDLGLDPPRVIGYQLPGRGRRELRADRILRIEGLDPAPRDGRLPTLPPLED